MNLWENLIISVVTTMGEITVNMTLQLKDTHQFPEDFKIDMTKVS